MNSQFADLIRALPAPDLSSESAEVCDRAAAARVAADADRLLAERVDVPPGSLRVTLELNVDGRYLVESYLVDSVLLMSHPSRWVQGTVVQRLDRLFTLASTPCDVPA